MHLCKTTRTLSRTLRGLAFHSLHLGVALLILLFPVLGKAQTAVIPTGSGTSGDPYLIATPDNLYWLSQSDTAWGNNFYYQQTADIDASSTSTWDEGAGFSPIGNNTTHFRGEYEGNNYTISGLSINRSLTSYIGLFGYLNGATISNLGLVNVHIEGATNTGALAGLATGSTSVTNTYSTGSVSGGNQVGGLIGSMPPGSGTYDQLFSEATVTGNVDTGGLIGKIDGSNNKISSCYATGNVTGTNFVGGLVGLADGSSLTIAVENCYATGNAHATSTEAGGLIGELDTRIVSSSYSTGSVSGSTPGGLIGSIFDGEVSDSYWNTETSGQSDGIGSDNNSQTVTGLTSAEMLFQSSFSGFDFLTTWAIEEYASFPYLQAVVPDTLPGSILAQTLSVTPEGSGTELDPYLIADIFNLRWLSENSSAWTSTTYIEQTADIDASITSTWNSGAGFSPIGNSTTNFSGEYEGNNYTISGLFIDRSSTPYKGLFGLINGASISNLGLLNVDIEGASSTGALVGLATGSTSVTNSYSTGSVSGDANVGGLIGFVTSGSGTYEQVFSEATVTGSGSGVGGLIGDLSLSSSGKMSNCYATGNVTGSVDVGGLVGYAYAGGNLIIVVENCYATGNAHATGSKVGGLIGTLDGTIVSSSYSTGLVSGSTPGGLIGENFDGEVSDSYWNTETSGQSDGIGSDNNSQTVTGLTTSEFLSRSNFNLGDAWIQFSGFTDPFLASFPIDSVNGLPYSSYVPNGSGSEGDPYLISNLENIQWLSAAPFAWDDDIYFQQTADIDASTTSTWDAGAGFSPIGNTTTPFEGEYEGNNYTISGLFINRSSTPLIGLFGYINGASISNLGLLNVDIEGFSNTGALVGLGQNNNSVTNAYSTGSVFGEYNVGGLIGQVGSDSGTYEQLFSEATVTGSSSSVGGLIGQYRGNNSVSTCYATGNVTGSNNIGGLIGTAYDAGDVTNVVENCYATGNTHATGSPVGGLVGLLELRIVSSSYSTGFVSGSTSGGLIGQNFNGEVSDSYWNTETSGQSDGIGSDNNSQTVTGLTSSEFLSRSNFNFGDAWIQFSGFTDPFLASFPIDSVNGLPYSSYVPNGSGSEGDPYLISNLENIQWLSAAPFVWDDDAYFQQTADIDASATSTWDSGAGFSPIGNTTTNFNGDYEGNNYTISGLFIDRSSTGYIGLFGYINGASISNIGLLNVDMEGASNTGALAGLASGSTSVINSYSTGSVSGNDNIGGLIGHVPSGSGAYEQVFSETTVTGDDRIGGLVGQYGGSNAISSCYTTGNVTGSSEIGGLVGNAFDVGGVTNVVENCYATGTVHATSSEAGGLIGLLELRIINSSYSTGSVSGSTSGGLIGQNFNGEVSDSYWNTETSGQSDGIGSDNNSQTVTGLTSAQMQQEASFSGFDFANTWGIVNGFLEPYLQAFSPDSIGGYPLAFYPTGSGTGGDPYQITTLDNLLILSQAESIWDSDFIQTTNIDATPTSGWNSGAGFESIGSTSSPFTGSFDGQDFSITGLFINRADEDTLGLFGRADSAALQNIQLLDVDITGNDAVGALAGVVDSTIVNDISVSGSVTANANVGGLIGRMNSNTATNIHSAVMVSADSSYSGGLIGFATNASITDCSVSATVTGDAATGGVAGFFTGSPGILSTLSNCTTSGDISGSTGVGGLVGNMSLANIGSSNTTGTISASGDYAGGIAGAVEFASNIRKVYSLGNVTSTADNVGGLVGLILNEVHISNSYSLGDVSTPGDFVGGLVGAVNVESTITNSYATGSVSGNVAGGLLGALSNSSSVAGSFSTGKVTGINIGGLIGVNSVSTVSDSYWNTQTSGLSTGIGFDVNSQIVTGLTTAQMIDSTNFSGFDFASDTVWAIDDGFTFPYLPTVSDLRMVVATIDSGEGWRMVGNRGDVTYSDLLDPLWTQGFTGADTESGSTNVYFYEEATQTWTAPSKASDYFGKADSDSVNTALNGILLYVYGDDDNDGNQDSWPKYIISENTTVNDTLDVSLSYTDNVSADSAGWNLVSNPYPVSLDWTEVVTNGDITNTFPVAYIWDDSLNAGSGAYRINYGYPLPPGLPQDLIFDGAIPAMQAFWVKATSTGASLSIKPDYQGASQVLYKQLSDRNQKQPAVPWISLSISSGDFSDQVVLFASDDYKAPKLKSIAGRYTEISIEDEEQLWAATSLSLDSLENGEQLHFPIHLSTTETGTFTFTWNGLDTFGSYNFELRDHLTGESISLSEGNTYFFELEAGARLPDGQASAKHSVTELRNEEMKSPLERGFRGVSAKAGKVESISTRFDLRVAAGTLVSDELEQDLPATYALAQNYPNPFNPSTSIQFELPESGNVELLVFDVLGRQVATLVDDRMEAGSHQIRFDASALASGVYLYQLRAGSTVLTKKLTLIK